MYFGQLFYKNKQFFIGQRCQLYNGSGHIAKLTLAEAPFGKAGFQRLVAVNAAPRILNALRRAAHYNAHILRLALHGVVVHGQNFLLIILPGDGVGNFVDVHQLVNEDEHTGVARLLEKTGE